MWHVLNAQAEIEVTVKGARPQPKFYSDLHGSVEGVGGCYGPGLEPSIWQACGPVCHVHDTLQRYSLLPLCVYIYL